MFWNVKSMGGVFCFALFLATKRKQVTIKCGSQEGTFQPCRLFGEFLKRYENTPECFGTSTAWVSYFFEGQKNNKSEIVFEIVRKHIGMC
jgi:hypothetical protein